MTPTRSRGPVEPAKKRRSFFSSKFALIPALPAVTTSRPAITPSSQVLAALSDPTERSLNAPRAFRERKQRVIEGQATEEVVAEASASRPAITRSRSPPKPKSEQESEPAPLSASRPRRTRFPTIKAITPLPSPARRIPNSLLPSPAAAAQTTPLFEPPKGRRGSKAVNAQNSNAALSALMEKSMRATIGGRERPYMRVPVWEEPSKSRKKSKTTIIIRRPASRPAAVTARQKAKQRLKEEEQSEEEADEFEDVEEEPTPAKMDKGKGKQKDSGKKYMSAGFYCQDPNAKSPFKLVNKVLEQGSSSKSGRRKAKEPLNGLLPKLKRGGALDRLTFPPLPYDHGYQHFFGKEHEFVLPYDIHQDAQNGAFNDKKKPAPYQKIRGNVFPERQRVTAERAICRCDPDSGCADNCINRLMNYICGKDCPCGENCTNRSLAKRAMAATKVGYTGLRGFGLFAEEDIKEGDFVTDYRGEVISLNTFYQRIQNEYAGQKNFYALAYDQDEVVDSGMRGNDARFINHGCNPNLEVRKYQTLGDGMEEYEIGMWASRDIKAGEELFYDYNFDSFGGAKDELRTQCRCGAPNCIGFLGRKPGEKSAKEIALDLEAKKAAEAVRATARNRLKVPKKVGTKKPIKFSGAVQRAKQALNKKSALHLKAKIQASFPKQSEADVFTQPSELEAGPSNYREEQDVEISVTTTTAPEDPFTAVPSTSTTTTTLTSTAPPLTPNQSADMDGDAGSEGSQSAASKRKSGWANWLRKIAAEKTRTLEDWHEERMKRRRGIAWMNMMIAEFGVAPSTAPATPETYADGRKPAGSSASFANTLAAQGLGPGPAGIRNLGGPKSVYRPDNGTKSRDEMGGTPIKSDLSPTKPSVGQSSGSSSRKRKSRSDWSESRTPAPHATPVTANDVSSVIEHPVGHSDVADHDTEESRAAARKITQKKQAIAARNGAPMGWAFDVQKAPPTRDVGAVVTELPRSARRARQSTAAEEARVDDQLVQAGM